MLKGAEGKLATNWNGAGELGGPTARPKDGSRMVVRTAPNQLKSKWAGVPPRPAAPPPLPTNEKMNAEMQISLEASDEKSGLLDSVVVTLPKPKKLNYASMPDRIPGLEKLADTARAPQLADFRHENTSQIEASKAESGNWSAVKWRVELKCKDWQRPIGVLTETPTATFKLAHSILQTKKLEVRGSSLDVNGKSSLWSE